MNKKVMLVVCNCTIVAWNTEIIIYKTKYGGLAGSDAYITTTTILNI